jgi:hypothetical protein
MMYTAHGYTAHMYESWSDLQPGQGKILPFYHYRQTFATALVIEKHTKIFQCGWMTEMPARYIHNNKTHTSMQTTHEVP